MNQTTTSTTIEAKNNFYKVLFAANLNTAAHKEIMDAATDWIASTETDARQSVLNAYRSNNFPYDKTYGA